MNEDCAALDTIDLLREAAPRFHEHSVKAAYDGVMHTLEAYGDGALYEDEPLSETQLALLASVLPELFPGDMPTDLYRAYRALSRALRPLKPVWSRPAEPAYTHPSSEITNINVGDINHATVSIIGSQRTTYMNPHASYGEDNPFEEAPETDPELKRHARIQYDVFMSYAHRDGSTMRRIVAKLCDAGLQVWTDESLEPGTPSWVKAIEDAIQSSVVVVVALTPNAMNSNFANKEILTAQDFGTPIVPLVCKGDERYVIPLTLRGVQWLDCRTEGEFRKSMIRLIAHVHNLKKEI
ncbi:MAG: toll/interleukin-1 receptor domain-containing protein [Anaerolineae bacterium]|nr:toll/interleukin-1 receptor domain-containing protein [Anaerolineae bacterium]